MINYSYSFEWDVWLFFVGYVGCLCFELNLFKDYKFVCKNEVVEIFIGRKLYSFV